MEPKEFTQEMFDDLTKKLNMQSKEIGNLVELRDKLLAKIDIMEQQVKGLIGLKVVTEDVIQREIQRLNGVSHSYLEENQRLIKEKIVLQDKIKELNGSV